MRAAPRFHGLHCPLGAENRGVKGQHVSLKQIRLIAEAANVGAPSAQSGVDRRKEHVPISELGIGSTRTGVDHGSIAVEVDGRRTGSDTCLGHLMDGLPPVEAVPSPGHDSK